MSSARFEAEAIRETRLIPADWKSGGLRRVPSGHYKAIADEFQVYENNLPDEARRWFTDRYNRDDVITFGNGQEAVIFMGMDGKPRYSDITVILPEL